MKEVPPTAKASPYGATRVALRGVALFEATKGFAALAALLGWLSLVHHDVHLRHLRHEPAWQSVVVLVGNGARVGFLGWRLWLRRRANAGRFA